MKTNKKYPVTQWIRHGIQLAAFFLYPGLFISVFAAIRDVIMAAVNRTFSMQTEGTQLLILLAVFPITVLWGRFFCGYLCSFGAMGDLVHFLSSGLHIRQLPGTAWSEHQSGQLRRTPADQRPRFRPCGRLHYRSPGHGLG